MIALTLTFVLGILGLFTGPSILPVIFLFSGLQTSAVIQNIEVDQQHAIEVTEQVTPDEEAPSTPEVHTPSLSQ